MCARLAGVARYRKLIVSLTDDEIVFVKRAAIKEGISASRLARLATLSRLGWSAPIPSYTGERRRPSVSNPRTEEMVRMRLSGMTLQAIGDKYKITRERVRQLVHGAQSMSTVRGRLDRDIYIRTADDARAARSLAKWWSQVEKSEECWNWTGTRRGQKPNQYGAFNCPRLFGKEAATHRQSFYLSRGYFPRSPMWVLHRCNNSVCVRPDHLYAGTPAENTADAIASNGGIHWMSQPSVTERNAEMVALRKSGVMPAEIAERFGVKPGFVSRVIYLAKRKKGMT